MRFFTIPMQDSGSATGELNGFLSNHRILTIERHFVADGTNSAWAICVNYLDSVERATADKRGGGGRVDYREILSDPDFTVFAKLRSLRKTLAEQDGVPAYALFTNEQLADMVRNQVTSLNALEQIVGVGPARTKKYGAAFLEHLKATSGLGGTRAVDPANGREVPLETADGSAWRTSKVPGKPRRGRVPAATRQAPASHVGAGQQNGSNRPEPRDLAAKRSSTARSGRPRAPGYGSAIPSPGLGGHLRPAFASGSCTTPCSPDRPGAGSGARRRLVRLPRRQGDSRRGPARLPAARRFPWYVKMDIRAYFASIDHAILERRLRTRLKGEDVLRLIHRVVAAHEDAPGKGLPIGSLTSQILANDYLDPLDRFLLETCKVDGLVRYMDDFRFWTRARGRCRADADDGQGVPRPATPAVRQGADRDEPERARGHDLRLPRPAGHDPAVAAPEERLPRCSASL